MKDAEYLEWLAERLVNVYGESESVDFVHKLRAVAKTMPAEQDTPWYAVKSGGPEYRIALRDDDDGELDDVYVTNVSMFRMERMDDHTFWLCCYFPDGDQERITFWLNAKKGHIYATVTETPRPSPSFTYEPEKP